MLKNLKIQQFVIIEKLDVDFRDKLTIITGETGAGKSIILGALGLVLGDPSKTSAIRQGYNESVIEATIAPPQHNPAWKMLIQKDLAEPGQTEFNLLRIIRLEGEETIEIDGKPVEQKFLKSLGENLVEIHGQFANQSMLGPDNQLNLLDLSGKYPPEVFKNVGDALDDVHKYTQDLEDERAFLAAHKHKAGEIEKIVGQFEEVGMQEGFVEAVTSEHDKLQTAKETLDAFQSILSQFIATNGVTSVLTGAQKILERQKNLDPVKIKPLAQHLENAIQGARGVVFEMRKLQPEYEIDLDPLTRLREVLRMLQDIAHNNKLKMDQLYPFFKDMFDKRSRIRNQTQNLKDIENKLIDAKNRYREHAKVLSEKRKVAAENLSKIVTSELAPLKLPKAEFKVLVEERPDMPWTKKGFNVVTFTARMNLGMPFSPISETASGGEMARLILAMKAVLQRVQQTPTLVFDEVDIGIGGAAAAAVGERLAFLSDSTQVAVITHSPQVASRGDQHLHISKKTDDVTTTSSVRELQEDERIDEISRMLAGDTITEQSREAAKTLIAEARAASQARRAKAAAEAEVQQAQQAAQPQQAAPEQPAQPTQPAAEQQQPVETGQDHPAASPQQPAQPEAPQQPHDDSETITAE